MLPSGATRSSSSKSRSNETIELPRDLLASDERSAFGRSRSFWLRDGAAALHAVLVEDVPRQPASEADPRGPEGVMPPVTSGKAR